LADSLALLLKTLELMFAERRKRYMDFIIGTDRDTKSSSKKATNARIGAIAANMMNRRRSRETGREKGRA
jgi:hypothetical protein